MRIIPCGQPGLFDEIVAVLERVTRSKRRDYTIWVVGDPRCVPKRFAPDTRNILYAFEQRMVSGYERFDAILTHFPRDDDATSRPPRIPLRMGWDPVFETDVPSSEDTPLLYVGSLREARRGEVGQQCGDIITQWSGWGEDRNSRIRAAAVNLMVRPWPDYTFPTHRWHHIACKRKFCLVDEHPDWSGVDPGILDVWGRDGALDLRAAYESALALGPRGRQARADAVYDYLRSRPSYAESIEVALDTLDAVLGHVDRRHLNSPNRS